MAFHAGFYFTQRARRSRESLTIGGFTQSRCLRQLRKGAKSAKNNQYKIENAQGKKCAKKESAQTKNGKFQMLRV